jgi:hypothetical protein
MLTYPIILFFNSFISFVNSYNKKYALKIFSSFKDFLCNTFSKNYCCPGVRDDVFFVLNRKSAAGRFCLSQNVNPGSMLRFEGATILCPCLCQRHSLFNPLSSSDSPHVYSWWRFNRKTLRTCHLYNKSTGFSFRRLLSWTNCRYPQLQCLWQLWDHFVCLFCLGVTIDPYTVDA